MSLRIYFFCPDKNAPSGGVKQIYRQVDVLNRHGLDAAVLHSAPGVRQTWFKNNTRVVSLPEVKLNPVTDILVLPEIYGPQLAQLARGVRKVIFNQNCFYTFKGYPLTAENAVTPYLSPDTVAAMTTSDDSRRYLEYAFPKLKVYRVRCGLLPEHFYYGAEKRRQIAFMPRKIPEDAVQVNNILKFRNALRDFKLVPIHNQSEAQTAAMMREALIFVSYNYCEGFGLPPVEAMACGCVVVGYPGRGGLEYFKPEFSYPVEDRNVIGLAQMLERVIALSDDQPELLARQGRAASAFATAEYSLANEECDILRAWKNILSAVS